MMHRIGKTFIYLGALLTVLFLRSQAEAAGLAQLANPVAFFLVMFLLVLTMRTVLRG